MTTELKNRIIWGIAPALLVLVVLFVLPLEFTFLLAIVCGLLGWREYARMMDIKQHEALLWSGYFFVTLMFAYAYFLGPQSLFWIWALWTWGFSLLFFEYVVARSTNAVATLRAFNPQRAWSELCRFVMGVIYIFMMFGFVGPIAGRQNGELILLLAFLVIFVGDTTAYFVGKKWGKQKLWPDLSPGKTIEGALAGIAGSVLAAVFFWLICAKASNFDISFWKCILVGLVAAPLAQAGDFIESLMKRAAGQKDSGSLLPGHGGLLDRTDGLVFVMPLVYFLF